MTRSPTEPSSAQGGEVAGVRAAVRAGCGSSRVSLSSVARAEAVVLAAMLLAGPTVLAGAGCDRPSEDAAGLHRPPGALSAEALREVTVRLTAFGPRSVGDPGHDPAASYVGGRLLLAGCKPILTDPFECGFLPDDADAEASRRAACGSVVAFAHALPLADAWSRMKGQAEAFTFDHPPRADLASALRRAACEEGVSRLTPFDVFKRPSPLFPRAVVRCLLRRRVRAEAGAEADAPRARSAVMARMLRRLARAHEAVLLAAPLDMRPAPGAGKHGADESASLVTLCALAEHVVCESLRPRRRTLICAALDGHWRGAAGARSLARMLGPGEARAPRTLRGGSPDPPRAGDSAAGRETRRAGIEAETRPTGTGEAKAQDASEDTQLAALLGPSSAAARAATLAETLEARPADPAVAAEAEDALVRLLRLEPYAVRLVLWLDLASGGRRVAVHVVGADGKASAALGRWLSEKVERAGKRGRASFSMEAKKGPEPASGRAVAALASAGRPAVLLRTADAPRDHWFTGEDTTERVDFAALADQARAVAALMSEVLAAEALPGGRRPRVTEARP